MSTASIRKALETRLAALSPAVATQYEGVAFQPVNGTPYQRANLLPGQPDNSEQGSQNYLEVGVFQVTLCYPLANGTGDVGARAELLRQHFKRGTTMTQDGINVIVIRTPAVAAGYPDGDRYKVPVSITYQAHVSLS